MKKTVLATAIGSAMVLTLTGCGEEPRYEEPTPTVTVEDMVHKQAIADALSQSNKEQQELKAFLEEAKKKDPSIVDAYYSLDANGNKIINIVRNNGTLPATSPSTTQPQQDEGLSSLETVGLAVAGGLAGAALANAMIPDAPSPSYYHQRSAYHYTETKEEERRRRGTAVAGYNNHLVSRNISSIRSNPTKMSAIKANHTKFTTPKLTTSKPAFRSSTSGARSGAYGGKGGGFGG